MKNKYNLKFLNGDSRLTVEAESVVLVHGLVYQFFNKFDRGSDNNELVASYPAANTIIVNVDRLNSAK